MKYARTIEQKIQLKPFRVERISCRVTKEYRYMSRSKKIVIIFQPQKQRVAPENVSAYLTRGRERRASGASAREIWFAAS